MEELQPGTVGEAGGDLRSWLSMRIHQHDIREMCLLLRGNEDLKQSVYALLTDSQERVANNAAWVLTHLPLAESSFLLSRRNELIDACLRPVPPVKLGLLLSLLEAMPPLEELRTDFLDFCLERMMSGSESNSVRSLCIKQACVLCKPYPELQAELCEMLELMSPAFLPPSVRCARKKVLSLLRCSIRKTET